MSYTLKKLKQSEIDHGYQKPGSKINTKPSYGIFIACFVITLSFILVILHQGTETSSKPPSSSSNQIAKSFNEIPSSITLQDKTVDIGLENNNEANDKITLSDSKEPKSTEIISTQSTAENKAALSELIEPKQIAQVEKELLIESPVNLTDEPEEQDSLAANIDVQTSEKNTNDSGKLETIQTKNNFELDNAIQNDQPVLWQDLSLSFRSSMPEMKLNGIVFLDNEEDRYIFINMTKYQIDDVVLETGPTVEEIKQHSVIMNYEERLFILALN